MSGRKIRPLPNERFGGGPRYQAIADHRFGGGLNPTSGDELKLYLDRTGPTPPMYHGHCIVATESPNHLCLMNAKVNGRRCQQGCIPVGCILLTLPPYEGVSLSQGVSMTETPWTETPLDREPPLVLDRNPPGQRRPGQRHPPP